MITLILIAITAIVSIQAFSNRELYSKFIFAPHYMTRHKEWYRFFSYGLLHADWTHLVFNLIAFYSFGQIVEDFFVSLSPEFGKVLYLALYVTALPVSSMMDYIRHKNNSRYLAVGASGAVSAVIFASILIYPKGGIYIFPIPFAVPAYIFGPLFLAFSAYMSKNSNSNIGHAAHFYGAVYGLIFTIAVQPKILPYFIHQVF